MRYRKKQIINIFAQNQTVMKKYLALIIGALTLLPACNKIDDEAEGVPVEEPVVEVPQTSSETVPNQDVEYGFLSDEAPETLSATENENVLKVNTFAVSAARQFGKTVAGNYVFSPVSLAYLLGMLSNGAAGATRDEICAALGFGAENQQDINEFCRDLMVLTSRNTTETEVLEIANTCVADNQFPMIEEYRKDLHNYYDALVRNMDFTNKEGVADYINDWASEHTHGRIKKVVDKVNGVMCLVNGMYFKGKWATPFVLGPWQEKFIKETGEKLNVDMMHIFLDNGRYYKGKGFQAVTIDYGKEQPSNYSMSFFLPDKGNGIEWPGFYEGVTVSTMLSNLNGEALSNAITSSKECLLYIQIPPFEIKMDKSIVYDFKTLGMNTMFEELGADFSRMTERPAFVTDVKHVASIKVDENGSEATAISHADIDYASDPEPDDEAPKIIYFIADHPFMFVITENTTGAIMFMGCYRG